jgi:hypothetical protein
MNALGQLVDILRTDVGATLYLTAYTAVIVWAYMFLWRLAANWVARLERRDVQATAHRQAVARFRWEFTFRANRDAGLVLRDRMLGRITAKDLRVRLGTEDAR